MQKFISTIFVLIIANASFAQAVDQTALAALLKKAEAAHSSAVVIMKDGKVISESYFGNPKEKLEIMSCTKSVVGLAVGQLVDAGKIRLDQPVSDFYPEWGQGGKKFITIRHLLNHTSGLQNVPNATVEIYPAPNTIKLALSAELADAPGTRFAYNNKAVNLLAGIIEKASGKRMDLFIVDEIFKPLGITDYRWGADKDGDPYAMAGLQLNAADFAKLGQLVLNRGTWEGKQIVSAAWLDESMAKPGQPFYELAGLLWWRVPASENLVIDDAKFKELEDAHIDPAFIAKLAPFRNKPFNSSFFYFVTMSNIFHTGFEEPLTTELATKKIRLTRRETGEIVGYSAVGDLGQYLIILPKQNLVAVRLIKPGKDYLPQRDWFADFAPAVMALVNK